MTRYALSFFLVASAFFARSASASEPAREGPLHDPAAFREADLVEIVAVEPSIRLDLRYATSMNFVGRPLYPEARAFLERPAAEALARVHRALRRRGLGIVVFDAYRPWSVTRTLWESTPPEKRRFVADPAVGSKHNRGCAVDVGLYELASGRILEMPSAYDEMSERAYVTYDGGDPLPRERRDLLIEAMGREGFFVYPFEWWHFDYKDWRDYPVLDLSFREVLARHPGRLAIAPFPVELAASDIVDLSHPFDERTLYWPTAPSGFELRRLHFGKTEAGYFYAANSFCAPEHGGTHLDAPIHFAERGDTADRIPLRRLIGPGVVLDISAQASQDPDYRLRREDIAQFEAAHGRIPPGSVVLLRTGWSRFWPDRKRYFGDDTPGDASRLRFPSYGNEAAELLVLERGVAALGVDTASIDYGRSADFPVHRIAAGANVPGLENLAGLDALPASGFWVVALPMKIGGGSGGPLRIVAVVPRGRP